MFLRLGSKMRRFIQNKIQTIGMLKWNTDPSNNNKELLVSRRPNAKLNKKATDYLICPNCLRIKTITNLRNHFKNCTNGTVKGVRNIKVQARGIEGRLGLAASDQLREIFPVMREDSIVHLIRYDSLLIVYGNLLCMKYNFHFQQNMIRAKLRLAGRVLQALTHINDDVTDFASIYHPKRYKSVIEAIKVVGKFDPMTNEFNTPATASSAVTLVKQIGAILKCEYIEAEDPVYIKKTEDFLFLMESQLTSIINKRVKESQLEKKRQNVDKLPSKVDVRLFADFLTREREACFQELTANFSKATWVKLSELTIASVIVFNRRRIGETQNILVADFEKRESINETSNEELFNALSEESKKVARRFNRMQLRGKKGVKNVYVLMKADISQCIELLMYHRLDAGVPSNNKYLFALPPIPGDKRIKVVNACNVLATLSKKCGAKDPSRLRGTNLRKHFATFCMAMELNDDMTSEVAKFMGHAESVHREYYRCNTIDREVVKISKLLEAAQGIEEQDFDDSADTSDNEKVNAPKCAFQAASRKRKSIDKDVTGASASQKRKKIDSKKKSCVTSVVGGAKINSQTRPKRMKVEKEHQKKKFRAATVHNAKSGSQSGRKGKKINAK